VNGAWTTLALAGKTVDLYEPPALGRSRFALVYLHSGEKESLRDRPALTRLLDELTLPCIAPHGDWSWWADRICPEFDTQLTAERFVVDQVVPEARRRWQPGPRGLGIAGISMGGQGALRLAFKHPELFPVVAGISSSLDYHEWYGQGTVLDTLYDSKEQCRQDTALMHIHPHHYPPHIFFCIDPDDARWYRGNDRLHEKLNALGIPHEVDLTTRAGGHAWSYFEHMSPRTLRFVAAGLEQESRRLL
jgi:S-formylglutathione hydrolase